MRKPHRGPEPSAEPSAQPAPGSYVRVRAADRGRASRVGTMTQRSGRAFGGIESPLACPYLQASRMAERPMHGSDAP